MYLCVPLDALLIPKITEIFNCLEKNEKVLSQTIMKIF